LNLEQMAEAHEAEMLKQHMELTITPRKNTATGSRTFRNSWMVATVIGRLDKQRARRYGDIGAEAETKIRETCSQVFDRLATR